ncbi:MAG: ATP-binding protein [Gammaproteobacteria bacterium]
MTKEIGRIHFRRPNLIEEVGQRLTKNRFLTVTGSPGIGKSTLVTGLATYLMDRYDDTIYVDLADVRSPAFLTHEIAGCLATDDVTLEITRGRDDERIVSRLSKGRTLLVLDNCDSVGAPVATIAHRLGALIPTLTVLLTSPTHLGYPGELTYPLRGLGCNRSGAERAELVPSAEAVSFSASALAMRNESLPEGSDLEALASICRMLRGNPLAITIALSNRHTRTYRLLAEELADAVVNPTVRNHARDRSIDAIAHVVIRWAYSLLPASEALLLTRASIFSGGFSLAAATGICSDIGVAEVDVHVMLKSLTSKALLDAGSRRRYAVPRTVRRFGGEMLAQLDSAGLTAARHLRWYRDLAEKAEDRVIVGGEQAEWIARLSEEFRNIRVALEVPDASHHEDRLRLGSALWAFALLRGHSDELAHRLKCLLSSAPSAPSYARVKALTVLGFLYGDVTQRRVEQAPDVLREGLAIANRLPASDRLAWPRAWALCELARHTTDGVLAASELEEALQIAEAQGNEVVQLRALTDLAERRVLCGDPHAALAHGEFALALATSLQSPGGRTKVLSILGVAYLIIGRPEASERSWNECLHLSVAHAFWPMAKTALQGLSDIADQKEDLEGLDRYAKQTTDLSRSGRVEPWRGDCMRGYAQFRRGNAYVGERLLRRALFLATDQDRATVLDRLAEVAVKRGDWLAARALLIDGTGPLHNYADPRLSDDGGAFRAARVAHYGGDIDEAVKIYIQVICTQRVAGRRGVSDALHAIGSINLDCKSIDASTMFFAAAHAAGRVGDCPSWLLPSESQTRDTEIQRAGLLLGQERFAAAWREGYETGLSDLIARWYPLRRLPE